MVELDQFKYTLNTYEEPLKEVRDSLDLENKEQRVEELEREAKQIQDIHRICETIIDKQIDVHSLNEEVLTGDRAVWMQRMEEILLTGQR